MIRSLLKSTCIDFNKRLIRSRLLNGNDMSDSFHIIDSFLIEIFLPSSPSRTDDALRVYVNRDSSNLQVPVRYARLPLRKRRGVSHESCRRVLFKSSCFRGRGSVAGIARLGNDPNSWNLVTGPWSDNQSSRRGRVGGGGGGRGTGRGT